MDFQYIGFQCGLEHMIGKVCARCGEFTCPKCEMCPLPPGSSCDVPMCMKTNCGICNATFKTGKEHNCESEHEPADIFAERYQVPAVIFQRVSEPSFTDTLDHLSDRVRFLESERKRVRIELEDISSRLLKLEKSAARQVTFFEAMGKVEWSDDMVKKLCDVFKLEAAEPMAEAKEPAAAEAAKEPAEIK